MNFILVGVTVLVVLLTVTAVVSLGKGRLLPVVWFAQDGIETPSPARPVLELPETFTAENLRGIGFTVSRRGYDPAEVEAVLARIGDQLSVRGPVTDGPAAPVPEARP